MECIKIDNLEVYAYHGVFEEEKQKGQQFYINAVLRTDLKKAGRTDCLTDSTHYGEVCLQIKKTMTEMSYDLIERAAEKMIEDILINFPLIQEVTIELRKPNAPIPMEFDSVSVQLTRGWHKVYVAFGSNMGEKETYIQNAVKEFKDSIYFRNIKMSDIFYSKPYGGVEQEDFVNGILEMETMLEPFELLEILHEFEEKAGRIRIQHWGPRTLDLDIIFYDDLVLDEKELQIPHKDMINRDFVLIPLAQLAGYKRHPLLKKTVDELVEDLKECYIHTHEV
ncbi:MAG: 2-amino-4-hydroxy-6-hydroxymethyldihydropteridine diphosphokinase [Lachnospiraceae bacterium]|nr:2-amino-4-hydroxy-6-hydroxymethyldihydropteridine diphosphokinase [Lachnospiraceae bacterium]